MGRGLPDTGELHYDFAGHNNRAFADARGAASIRVTDTVGLNRLTPGARGS